jgi:hypothetical protein
MGPPKRWKSDTARIPRFVKKIGARDLEMFNEAFLVTRMHVCGVLVLLVFHFLRGVRLDDSSIRAGLHLGRGSTIHMVAHTKATPSVTNEKRNAVDTHERTKNGVDAITQFRTRLRFDSFVRDEYLIYSLRTEKLED